MSEQLSTLISLSEQMDLEPAEETGCSRIERDQHKSPFHGAGAIHNAALPGGKQIALLKSLLTSACERNCFYCPFRAGRDYRRATLKPEEMANVFSKLHQAGIAEGLFLSSGIVGGGVKTQDALIDTAEILRNKLNYQGYLHLKLMPGAEYAQVERAMQLSNRVSINLEAPNTQRLLMLAPRKEFIEELLQPLKWVEDIRRNYPRRHGWSNCWPSSATQFVVGAVGESDIELLKTSEYLFRQLKLKRVYYSAFRPVSDTPLQNIPAESQLRATRLYQASFLLRDYGYLLEEITTEPGGNLPLTTDPKTAWANTHLAHQPLEINTADPQELIRIPGIGPASVRAIIKARSVVTIKSIDQLYRLGINTKRPEAYILLDGRSPVRQLQLF